MKRDFDSIGSIFPTNIPKTVAIRLIGDSFNFHVAHLFREDRKMLRPVQYFITKKGLNDSLGRLENV